VSTQERPTQSTTPQFAPTTTQPATSVTAPTVTPISPEEEKIRSELQELFVELLTNVQELAFEKATLEPKDVYTREELKDLFGACDRVIIATKKLHMFLRVHARRR
jgi:cob(I)alamin adenosyltransferase